MISRYLIQYLLATSLHGPKYTALEPLLVLKLFWAVLFVVFVIFLVQVTVPTFYGGKSIPLGTFPGEHMSMLDLLYPGDNTRMAKVHLLPD